jgi:hypothetical protein
MSGGMKVNEDNVGTLIVVLNTPKYVNTYRY